MDMPQGTRKSAPSSQQVLSENSILQFVENLCGCLSSLEEHLEVSAPLGPLQLQEQMPESIRLRGGGGIQILLCCC